MHEYAFVSIPVKRRRDGQFTETDYRDVIRERASQGWQFVQAITLDTHTQPRIDLVFTREEDR